VPDGDADLSRRCRAFVSEAFDADGERLPIDDSKRLFSGRRSLAPLELTALATLHPGAPRPSCLEEFARGGEPWPPWYAAAEELPRVVAAEVVERWRQRWPRELARAGIAPLVCEVRPVLESELNAAFARGTSKAEAVLARVAPLLARVAALDRASAVAIRVDRLGGRKYYEPFLRSVFPLRRIETIVESEAVSRYVIADAGRPLELSFEVGGERRHLPIALASVIAKYTRECFIARLNRYFGARRPGLAPTAGYPQDAGRWLAELGDALSTTERRDLVRER
jgi:hypothetical protein